MTNDVKVDEALRRSFPPDAVRPVDIHLDRQQSLTIRWADGHESRYPLPYLRRKRPCATCREAPPPKPQTGTSLTILPANIGRQAQATGAALVGHYAIQLQWADGHDTGIYDFRYLRAIDPPSTAAAG